MIFAFMDKKNIEDAEKWLEKAKEDLSTAKYNFDGKNLKQLDFSRNNLQKNV